MAYRNKPRLTRTPEPPLPNDTEREICREYGGWTNFTQSFGLKAWDDDDNAEAKAILEGLAELRTEERKAENEEHAQKKK